MKKQLLPAIALLALLTGCAASPSPTPNYDTRFGDSVRQARLMQTVNPSGAAAAPAAGMDGKAAKESLGRYQESFKTPPPVVNVINIGGSVAGGR